LAKRFWPRPQLTALHYGRAELVGLCQVQGTADPVRPILCSGA